MRTLTQPCIEHTGVVTQLIREAQEGNGDLAVLWLDFANVYGSIPHKLVETSLVWHHVPGKIRDLVLDYYSCCTVLVILFALAMNMLIKSTEGECRGPLTRTGVWQPPIRAFMDGLTVTTTSVPGCRWILSTPHQLGPDGL